MQFYSKIILRTLIKELKVPHFFINSNDVKNGTVSICDKGNYTHIAKSLRARTGEKLLLIDENQFQYETEIENITQKYISVKVKKSYKSNRRLDFGLYLAQSPLHSSAQNFVIEKAAELGTAGIYPILTDNCAVKKSVVKTKVEKWQKIAYEASKQCERADVPEVFMPTELENLCGFDKTIAFCERGTSVSLKHFLTQNPIRRGEKILAIIGPEGGFSEREFKYFEDNKIAMVTLGGLILKAETAIIAALGNIIYEESERV
jgi:16S rRNA (uracil1498-N3)-methyltransferase